ncbi:MAG: hypothetical protein ACJ72W_08775, partial [Actinoallomurus sp.]
MTTRRAMLRGIAAGGAAAPFAALGLPAAEAAPGRGVRTGFEVLRAGSYRELRGQKVGMVANPTAVIRDLTHEVDIMHGASGV